MRRVIVRRANLLKLNCLIAPAIGLFTRQSENVYFSRTAENVLFGASKILAIEWIGCVPEQQIINSLEKRKNFCEPAFRGLLKVNYWAVLPQSVACTQ